MKLVLTAIMGLTVVEASLKRTSATSNRRPSLRRAEPEAVPVAVEREEPRVLAVQATSSVPRRTLSATAPTAKA